jgi:hypothetical protein
VHGSARARPRQEPDARRGGQSFGFFFSCSPWISIHTDRQTAKTWGIILEKTSANPVDVVATTATRIAASAR